MNEVDTNFGRFGKKEFWALVYSCEPFPSTHQYIIQKIDSKESVDGFSYFFEWLAKLIAIRKAHKKGWHGNVGYGNEQWKL